MVSLVLLFGFLFFAAIGAIFGLVRGLNKSVIRFVTFLVAVVITFFVSGPITNLIAKNILIEGQTLGEFLLESLLAEEMIADILTAAPLLTEAILVAPAFVIAIAVLPLAFILLSFISWIVFLCIQRPVRKHLFKEEIKKSKDEPTEKKPFAVRAGKRFAGMGIGVVSGVIVFGMLMAPIFGIISMLPDNESLDEVIDTMVEQEILDADTANLIKTELTFRDKFVVKSYGVLGMTAAGKLYLSSVSEIEADGQKTNLPAEFDSVFTVAQVAIKGGLLKAIMDSESTSAIFKTLSNEAFVNELIGVMFESKLFCAAIPEVMAMAMESVAISLNVPANKEAVYNNMMDDIAKAVQDANINYAGIKAYEEANNIQTVDFAPMEDGVETPLMTAEEYEAEIQKLTDLTLKISTIINTAISGDNEEATNNIAKEIVKNVQSGVNNSGTDISTFNADSVKSVISAITVEESAGAVLAQMSDPAKFETDVPTVETITNSIRETVKNAVADTSKAQETANTLASAVSNFAGAVESATKEDGTFDIASLDFGKIADAVTGLQNSTLKDVGSSVLDLVVAGDLGKNEMVGAAVGAIKESYDNGENISGTINSAGALIVIGTTMGNGGEDSKETFANSFSDLVHNLDEVTLKLLPKILTSDLLVSLGVDKSFTGLVVDVADVLLRELMALKGAEDYETEIEAVLDLYDLAMKGVGNYVEEDVQTVIDSAMKSDAIYNTVIKLGDADKVLFEITTDDQRDFMINAIEKYYSESGKTEKEYNLYMAFAKVIGLGNDVELQ